jgi:hypothetical protein
MPSVRLPLLLVGAFLLSVNLQSQNVNTMHPGEIHDQTHPSPDDLRNRMANQQFQRDIKDLSELCAAMPDDMEHLKQGMVARDLPERLRRIEKLSKRVREQLARPPGN